MVKDIIKNSIKNIKKYKVTKLTDVTAITNQTVIFSDKFMNIESEIKQFLKIKMYNNKNVMKKNNNGKSIIKKLFKTILNKPNKYIKSSYLKNEKYRAISDYISGMTDRFAIQLYKSLK
jgi:dGTP triphosphohydrolase